MLISVIVPLYNAAGFIERCLRSIESQDFDDYETLIINDCSTDESMAIVERTLADCPRLSQRARLIHNSQNLGSAATRRIGMQEAKGDYVIQVDSDDYVDPHYLSRLYAVARAESADIVMCDLYFDSNGKLSRRRYLEAPVGERSECFRQAMAGIIHNGLWNKLVRRSLYVDNNIYPVDGINLLDDKSVTFRLIYFAEKICLLNEPLYYYNIANLQAITRIKRALKYPQTIAFVDLVDQFCASHEMDETMKRGIEEYKLIVSSAILYHANEKQLHSRQRYEDQVRWRVLFGTSAARFHHKLIVALSKLRLTPAVKLLRIIMGKAKS